MAVITATSVKGPEASKQALLNSCFLKKITLTTGSTSDDYVHPNGIVDWAFKPDTTDTSTVAYTEATRTFVIDAVVGVGKIHELWIWERRN